MGLFGLALGIFLVTILMLLGVSRATWKRVDRLQGEFTGLDADNFYWGERIQNGVLRVNDILLRFRLHGATDDRDAFAVESKQLGLLLEEFRTNAVTSAELEFSRQISEAYEQYLVQADKVKVRGTGGSLGASITRIFRGRNYQFPEDYQEVQRLSESLLALCDAFMERQRSAFDTFLTEAHGTLETFQRVLLLSVVLVVVLAMMLLLLLYRGMIAPLRHQLIESHRTLERQEKLASLGSLAAGVAHEIRNPLTAIRFRLFSLKRALPGNDSESEDMTVIASELDRLERIVEDFLRFARPSEPEPVKVPAQRLLQEVRTLMAPQLAKQQITLNLEDSELLWIRADPQQIKQVMINLIQNAADSIERDGDITLRVRQERAPNRQREGLAALEVSDTGKGIPPELEKRLFDPFFTTKAGGTGLGLSIAARIVEKHGGLIRCANRSGEGATFSVVLPHIEEHETNHSDHRG
jgi:signal transduction histidine kinase